jgi:hypothetical protein
VKDFKKLQVCRRPHALTLDIDGVLRAFPGEELYLTPEPGSQLEARAGG